MKFNNRNEKIQYLRAISILAVLMIHTAPVEPMFQVIIRPFLNYCVATFLFLSGYLTKYENDNWLSFYKKRITRVIIPYLIWSLLYSFGSKSGTTMDVVVNNILTARSECTMYYIFVYIQFVLLTPLLGRLAKSRYYWTGFLVSPLVVLVFKYYPLLTGYQFPSLINFICGSDYLGCCLGWLSYYYLGLLIGNNRIQVNYSFKTIYVGYVITLLIAMAESYIWLLLGDPDVGYQLKLSSMLLNSVFIILAYKYLCDDKLVSSNKVLKMIGDYSFGIFLSHMMVMRVLRQFPFYYEIPYVINTSIVLFLCLLFLHFGSKICGPKVSRYLGFA